MRVEWVCANSPLPSFPLWLFPCPCSILLPCPRRGRVHYYTPFFLFSLLYHCSHRTSGTILFTHHSLNPFLYFHFTLQMMLELKNLFSIELIKCTFLHIYSQYLFHIITHVPIIKTALTLKCTLITWDLITIGLHDHCDSFKFSFPSKGRLAAWLDNDDDIVLIWSWYYIYWRQACLVMMIGKWQLTGAWCRTAPDQPYNQVHPLQNTISTFKKYSTTLWDISALNVVPPVQINWRCIKQIILLVRFEIIFLMIMCCQC